MLIVGLLSREAVKYLAIIVDLVPVSCPNKVILDCMSSKRSVL